MGVSGEVVGVGNVPERKHGPSLQFSNVYLVKGDLRGSCKEQCPKL